MSRFEKMCTDGTCEVCSKKTKIVVVASSLGPISNAVCKDCFSKGLEPYSNILAAIGCCGKFPEDVNEPTVERVRYLLKELGKTEEEFVLQVNKGNEELAALCKLHDDAIDGCFDDELGGHHEYGFGWNPNGFFCGNCCKSSCKDCEGVHVASSENEESEKKYPQNRKG